MPRLPIGVALLVLFVSACGEKDASPTSPGNTNTPPPAATSFSLNGIVTSGGVGLAGAAVTIADGILQGQSRTTDTTGSYIFASLTPTSFTLQATASGHTPQNKAVNLTAANQTVSFALVKPNPIFIQTGVGDNVFTIPSYVSRIRIQGGFSGFSSNFIVYISGRLMVNELLGTAWGPTSFDGTYLTTGGVVEIRSSSGVSWAFTEVR